MTDEEHKLDLTRSMRVIKAMFGLFTVAMVVLIVGLWVDARDRDDEQDENRLSDAIASCERGNVTRAQINDVNEAQITANIAGEASNRAIHAASEAITGGAEALIAAFEAVGPLSPDARAAADAYLAAQGVLASTIEVELATASTLREESRALLEAAVLPMRDCSAGVVLEDPNATLPPEQG